MFLGQFGTKTNYKHFVQTFKEQLAIPKQVGTAFDLGHVFLRPKGIVLVGIDGGKHGFQAGELMDCPCIVGICPILIGLQSSVEHDAAVWGELLR